MLERAMISEVEPLDYFAVNMNINETIIYERAAQWCALAFSPVVPSEVPTNPRITRLEALAHVKTLRARIFDRDVLFTSAGLNELVRIKKQLLLYPQLHKRICLVPPRALREGIAARSSKLLLNQARTRLACRWPFASAHLDLTLGARIFFVVWLIGLVMIAALVPFTMRPFLVPLMAFLILLPAGLRLAAAWFSARNDFCPIVAPVPDNDLPVYTILIPLRDEANMVPQLAAAMKRLDYPPEKLDIKFVVESRSEPTIKNVMAALDDVRFELVIVPDQEPRTKPKALNFALPMARGEFVVVYDAEDIVQPDQLRRAVALFVNEPGLDCLQAELVIDNANENWLTALFCGEYAGQFGLLLPALSRWHMPLPLGGTSNHFRVRSLREMGGWDAFNVTEDADLGTRLTRLRYRISTFSSRTYEEAPITIGAWMSQRTRWMKGWMQTFIVHNRHPVKFLQDIGWRNFLVFQAFVGGMIISAPLHSVFFVVFGLRLLAGGTSGGLLSDPWGVIQIIILVAGYGSTFIVATLGLHRLGLNHLIKYQLLLPFYWIFNSLAAMLAGYELLTRPYFWAKTKHGITRFARGADAGGK
ncbi:Glycosyl transferase, group 2 family protein [hydrothermal vent metagenome]|uniref:Glycosyl transferase, group 2 family protein n=1 Tax=hydrothermal vent metagenome TaxID=652676 RepID=A0A3B0TV54_9ZZZZ